MLDIDLVVGVGIAGLGEIVAGLALNRAVKHLLGQTKLLE